LDREIFFINQILSKSDRPLTSAEISKEIYNSFGIKVSRKVTQNYLWSYFRNEIEYNPNEFSYKLKNDRFLIDDIDVISIEKSPRAICSNFEGSKIKVSYDIHIPIEVFIRALTMINYKNKMLTKNGDLIKQLNRIIEQIIDNDDQ
jgi:hypothetical protein